MTYISYSNWKRAEKQGDFTTASKELLREIKRNCNRIKKYPAEYQVLHDLYLSFGYVFGMTTVPFSIFKEIKKIRRDIKKIVYKL